MSQQLNIPEGDVEQLLVSLILDNRINGHIDQVFSSLQSQQIPCCSWYCYACHSAEEHAGRVFCHMLCCCKLPAPVQTQCAACHHC